jgi:uncharacterized protein YbjT (DUF2867 family)
VITVIGASGRSGAAVCRALLAEGADVVPVVRNAAKWRATGLAGTPRIADLTDAAALRAALAGAAWIVNGAHARHAPAILAAAPAAARFILLGSTRRFSRWPDEHGNGVRAGEAAFLASGRKGVMLHPTMIYGAQGEDNVQRLAALLKRIPFAPLPGGGRALVQPVHQDDLTAAILAALRQDWAGPEAIVVAGPRALPYRDFLAAVARAAGLRPPPVLPIPGPALMALAPLTRLVPRLPVIRAAEVRRLLEDKAFDVRPMRERLGVTGRELEDGLRLTFGNA